MNANQEIITYYDALAERYDDDRFANTYGNYIHKQELHLLNLYLDKNSIPNNLDLACGTGRFLDFANTGIDLSPRMVDVCTKKFPKKRVLVGDATDLPFENNGFSNILSFHLMMHLDKEMMDKIMAEAHRVLKSGGHFIFDIPSAKRRALTRFRPNGWHGANSESISTILKTCHNDWDLKAFHGIAFFPIHWIPVRFRRFFIALDTFFGSTFLKEYSSHLVIILKKR